jgi:hypothetical protein
MPEQISGIKPMIQTTAKSCSRARGAAKKTVFQEFDFTVKPFEKTGHQRFGWLWTSCDFPEIGGDGRIQFPRVIGRRLIPREALPRWGRVLWLGNQVYSLTDLRS